jgi:putative nucleotidyltransferase-like protein
MWAQNYGKNNPLLADTLSVLLPTPEQTLLLRACLLSGQAGHQAGDAWLGKKRELGDILKEDRLKGLFPLLFSALQRNGVEVDPAFLTVLRTASLREELRAKTYRRICREVLSAFATAGIPFVVLKGAALADTVYATPALRHSHDIDILLEEPDPSPTIRLLSSLRFAPLRQAVDPEWQDLEFIHESGLPLVLHRRLFPIPLYNTVTADLRARSQMRTIAGVAARILSPLDQLLHVCGHAASCASRESLHWVCDAWSLIKQYPDLDWDALLDCARRGHLVLPLSITLSYLAEELQAPLPSAFLERLSGVASRASTVEREVALRGARAGSRGRVTALLRLSTDWRSRVFVVKWILLPSPTYLYTMQLVPPAGWLPFYYLSRPVRYMARRLSFPPLTVRSARPESH